MRDAGGHCFASPGLCTAMRGQRRHARCRRPRGVAPTRCSLACMCPNSIGYPSMWMYMSFHVYFLRSYADTPFSALNFALRAGRGRSGPARMHPVLARARARRGSGHRGAGGARGVLPSPDVAELLGHARLLLLLRRAIPNLLDEVLRERRRGPNAGGFRRQGRTRRADPTL